MISPISSYFTGNYGRASSFGLKTFPCNKILMKVLKASSSGFNRCEIPRNGSHEIFVTMSRFMTETRKGCARFNTYQTS